MSLFTATVNHICHKTFPYLIISFLLWVTLGLTRWESYAIMALIIFIEKYNYKIGYFSSIIETHPLNNPHINNEEESEVEE